MRAKKHFGQHFLHDPYIIQKIVDAIRPTKEVELIEIGPGPGALTEKLIDHCKALHVIEVDNDMVDLQKNKFVDYDNFHIHHISVLDKNFDEYDFGHKLHICGNLPYNISTPLLFHLSTFKENIERMVFMMQKEVIDRIVAEPGSKQYGRLTVALGLRFASYKLFNVKPGAFNPPPKVDSSIVEMIPRKVGELPEVTDIEYFDKTVLKAFAQRRKTLRKALKGHISAETIQAAGLNDGARAEELSITDFIALANKACESQ